MKKFLFYISAILCTALASCENMIEELEFSDDNKLAVFAIMNTASTDNRIFVYYQDNGKLTPVKNAQINLYLNGELAETVTEYHDAPSQNNGYWDYDYGYNYNDKTESTDKIANYVAKTTFRPGDKVKIEVSSSSYNAKVWAETVVPMPVEISDVDTSAVMIDLDNDSNSELYYKTSMRLKSTQNTPGNYRLLAGFCIEEIAGIATIDGNTYEKIEDLRDTTATYSNISLEVKDDIALTDGKGYIQKENDDELFSMDTYYFNHYRIVAGSYFNAGEYTVSYYVEPTNWWSSPLWGRGYGSNNNVEWLRGLKIHNLSELDPPLPENWWENPIQPTHIMYEKEHNEYVYYKAFAISDEEYQYLRGRSNQIDLEWAGNDFVEPVVLKGNINGGLGIFAIEAVTEGRIKLKTPRAEYH